MNLVKTQIPRIRMQRIFPSSNFDLFGDNRGLRFSVRPLRLAHFLFYIYLLEDEKMAKKCPICGKSLGFLEMKRKAADGEICFPCSLICSSFGIKTVDSLKSYWEENRERQRTFEQTQLLKTGQGGKISIDATHQLFAFCDVSKASTTPVFYKFDEVESYEIEVVGQKTITKKKGGITRALIGNALAGGKGAIVGSITAKEETKQVGGIGILIVNLVTYAGKTQYRTISSTNAISFLDECLYSQSPVSTPEEIASSADEILKYKALLDQGIINQDEFDAKKKQLLG